MKKSLLYLLICLMFFVYGCGSNGNNFSYGTSAGPGKSNEQNDHVISISGRLADLDGNPISGASVTVSNWDNGHIVTDINGNFTVNVAAAPNGTVQILFERDNYVIQPMLISFASDMTPLYDDTSIGCISFGYDNITADVKTIENLKCNGSFVAISPDENFLYTSDLFDNEIRRFNRKTSEIITIAGGGTQETGRGDLVAISGPTGITVADDGNTLYVACSNGYTIKKITGVKNAASAGDVNVITIAGQDSVSGDFPSSAADGPVSGNEAELKSLMALVISPDNNSLYVSSNYKIKMIANVKNANSAADTKVYFLAVCDVYSLVLSKGGDILYGGDAYGSIGQVWQITGVADALNNPQNIKVTAIAGGGSITVPVSGQIKGNETQFNEAWGVALSANEKILYLADRYNIKKITNIPAQTSSDTLVSVFAGKDAAGTLDGIGTDAEFKGLFAMVMSNYDGIMYAVDLSTDGNAVRKITAVEK